MTRRYYSEDTPHVRKIRQKYGVNCFHTWGLEGGNPVLIAQRQGRVSIRRTPKKRR